MEKKDIDTETTMPLICGHYKEEVVSCIHCGRDGKATNMVHWYKDDYTCTDEICLNFMKGFDI